jgi:hypothetical protein
MLSNDIKVVVPFLHFLLLRTHHLHHQKRRHMCYRLQIEKFD